jgi:hypothetical protein
MVRMEGLGLRLLPGLSDKRSHSSTIPLFGLGGSRLDEAVGQLLSDMFEMNVFPVADLGLSLCEIAAAECL